MVWRGPMVTQALEQLLNETKWRDIDYLVVDLPPGTGDIQLTLAQRVPVTGAVIVTTPQDIALIDARKGFKMFEKVGIPVLGIVENMSIHICSKCGHEERIFGQGGGDRMCKDYGIECWARCPSTSASASRPIPASRPWWPTPTAGWPQIYRRSPAGWRSRSPRSSRTTRRHFPRSSSRIPDLSAFSGGRYAIKCAACHALTAESQQE